MSKATLTMASVIMISGLLVSSAFSAPLTLNDAQMDGVAAGGMEKVDGFVCPAISGQGVMNNDKFFPIGNGGEGSVIYYSFHGPDVSVPVHATNGNGAGRPGGDFSTPGDTDYSAIWGFRP